MCYQTDVKSVDLPGRYNWDHFESPHEKELALTTSRMLTRQMCKYSKAPLPFDPKLDLILSPSGEILGAAFFEMILARNAIFLSYLDLAQV